MDIAWLLSAVTNGADLIVLLSHIIPNTVETFVISWHKLCVSCKQQVLCHSYVALVKAVPLQA
jgi:hypothetical protein